MLLHISNRSQNDIGSYLGLYVTRARLLRLVAARGGTTFKLLYNVTMHHGSECGSNHGVFAAALLQFPCNTTGVALQACTRLFLRSCPNLSSATQINLRQPQRFFCRFVWQRHVSHSQIL